AYTGNDPKVAKITEKGYYFYNGTEWVKAGSDANDQLWAQRDNGGVTETYLKPADNKSDRISYYSNDYLNSGLGIKIGNAPVKQEESETAYTLDISSSAFKNTVSAGKSYFGGAAQTFELGKEHFDRNILSPKNYSGFYTGVFTEGSISGNIGTINGNISTLIIGRTLDSDGKDTFTPRTPVTNVNVGTARGGRFYTVSRTSGKISDLTGGLLQVNNETGGQATRMYAADARAINFSGKVESLSALRGFVRAGVGQVEHMRGLDIVASFEVGSGEAPGNIKNAYLADLRYNPENPNSLDNAYGIKIGNVAKGSLANYSIYTGTGKAYFNDDVHSTRTFYHGPAYDANSKTQLYSDHWSTQGGLSFATPMQWLGTNGSFRASWGWNGYRNTGGAWNSLGVNSSTVGSMIEQGNDGILFRIEDMNGITGQTAPNIRMTINPAGEVQINSLSGSGNRPVYADAQGKLVIGSSTTIRSAWVPDTASNSVQLAITSANGDRTTHPISITDEGMVRATSFQGVNGATIFPDYVFQKYYTGTSSIKADYNFKSLSQVEDFVKANGHLPGYKSAATIKAQGYVDLMETQLTNVEKIEELYLHSIEQDKALKAKDAEIADLKQRLERLEKLIQ
ncbi:hypothetical protein HMPREF9699_01968, partial [Bergeyella zoohelcum ATCC 43767]